MRLRRESPASPPAGATDGPAGATDPPGRAPRPIELLYLIVVLASAAATGRLIVDHDPLLFAAVTCGSLSAYALRSYSRQK